MSYIYLTFSKCANITVTNFGAELCSHIIIPFEKEAKT
jgi:hypothetical protein